MAFRIHGEVSLDGAMFKRGLHEIGGEATAFLKNFALGAVGIYSIEQAFTKTIDRAEELINTSKKLDVSAEQLQVLRHAAEENGIGFEKMATALERFNAVRENVLNGGKGSAAQLAALGRLGISREALENQTAAQSLTGQISDTARKSNAADIANDLKQVFGRGGGELFGVLKEDFGEVDQKLRAFGAIMDTTTAVELNQFKNGTGLISQVLAAEFAPVIVLIGKSLFEVNAALGTFGTALGTWAGSIAELINDPMRLITHPKDTLKDLFAGGLIGSAGDEAVNYWNKQQDVLTAFDERAKKLAYDLDHPKPPSTTGNPPDVKIKKEPHERHLSDALISSGNFLGAGAGAINTLAQQQLTVSQEQLGVLNEIKTALTTSSDDYGYDFED